MPRREIQKKLGLKDEKYFRNTYIQLSIKAGYVEMTIPEKPKSRLQKYRLTKNGSQILKKLKSK